MPVRQILAKLRPHGNDASYPIFPQHLLKSEQQRVEAELIADKGDQPFLFSEDQQFLNAVQIVREGFFDEKVTPGFGDSERRGQVQAGRIADDCRVGLFRECGIQIRELLQAVLRSQFRAGFDLHAFGDHRGGRPRSEGGKFQFRPQQRAQVAGMPLAHATHTDH